MHHNHPVVVDSHLAEEEVVRIHPAVGHNHQVLVDRSHLAEEEDRHNHLEVGIRRLTTLCWRRTAIASLRRSWSTALLILGVIR